MGDVRVYCDAIDVSLNTGPDIIDITPGLVRCIDSAGISDGTLSALCY